MKLILKKFSLPSFNQTEIVGTKDYRKPEWVSHMEEMQEALKGKKSCIDLVLRVYLLMSGCQEKR